VRVGYARNFLLPRQLATVPSDEVIADLAEKRKQAEAERARLRKSREAAIEKIEGLEITMTRACNDQGQLYGSVTQQDIASALTELGYDVMPREVRLSHTIKRIDNFEVMVKFDADLEASVKLHVVPDRELELEREDMEFDNEGNLIEKPARPVAPGAEAAAVDQKGVAAAKEAPEEPA